MGELQYSVDHADSACGASPQGGPELPDPVPRPRPVVIMIRGHRCADYDDVLPVPVATERLDRRWFALYRSEASLDARISR